MIKFIEDNSTYYSQRTKKNIELSDVTIAICIDPNTTGERLTKEYAIKSKKPFLQMLIDKNCNITNRADVTNFVKKISSIKQIKLNIAGNGIYTLSKHNISQVEADKFTHNLIFTLIKHSCNIIEIRSGGQTGFDEAGIKAAVKLEIPAVILAPKNWRFRDKNNNDISDKEKFISRFNIKSKEEIQTKSLPQKEIPNRRTAHIEITVKWETYNKFKKEWQHTLFNGKSPDTTWHFYTYDKAIGYICEYMEKRGAKPNNKKGVKYYMAENGYFKDGKFHQYANSNWDNGYSLFSQWIITGKWLLRITFEQYKPVELKRDYHDPKPNPWSHNATITTTDKKGYKTSRTIRTYKAEDPHDTSLQKCLARKKELHNIRNMFDDYTRHEYGMTASEYENRDTEDECSLK